MRSIIILYCLLPCLCFAQAYNFIPLPESHGQLQSQVYAALCDHKGYMWFGTQGGGVVRYDGVGMLTFTTDNGLPSNFVQTLYEDALGNVWVGTTRGVCRIAGKSVWAPNRQDYQIAYAFVEKRPGVIWIGTHKGLYTYTYANDRLEKLEALPTLNQIPIYAMLETKRGLWLGTHRGAYFLDKDWISFNARNGLPNNPVYAFAPAVRDAVWFSSFGDGVVLADEQKMAVRTVLRHEGLERAMCLYTGIGGEQPDRDALWVGTQQKGIVVVGADGSVQTRLAAGGKELPSNDVRALVRDRGGNLWATFSGGGAGRLGGQVFRHYDRADGMAAIRTYALMEDKTGAIWVSIAENGLMRLDSAGLSPVGRDSGWLQGIKCKSLLQDTTGNIWAATEGKGILIMGADGRNRVLNRANGGLPADWVRQLVQDRRGDIWVATFEDGIARLTPQADGGFALRVFKKRDGLTDDAVTSIVLDKKGQIWFGVSNGSVGFFKNGKVEATFGRDAGLPSVFVTDLRFDDQDYVWVATKGGGVFCAPARSGAQFQRPQFSKKLRSDNIYQLCFDGNGFLWAGSEFGVERLQLRYEAKGPVVEEVATFGKSEGFWGGETCQSAAFCDRAGALWFGTMNGFTKCLPSKRKQTALAPPTHFESILLMSKPFERTNYAQTFSDPLTGGFREGMALPWNQNSLVFTFKAIDLAHPQQIRYRYKLVDADKDWSAPTTNNTLHYAQLAPGQYRLLVQATHDGTTFGDVLAAPFTIKKPFWQWWWVQLLFVAVAIGVAMIGVRTYIRRVKQAAATRQAQLELQNRLLQLEQKALQLQMNPHFIFNALNSIQSLIAVQDYAVARQEIANFAKLMRGILQQSRQPKISLQEEMETLGQYLTAEQFCQQNPFEFSIRHEGDLDPEAVELPPMLLQPFVENAVIHGVAPLDRPGLIEVGFRLEGETLYCTIADNGIGREKAAQLRESKKPGHQSAAMQVTKERLEALGGGLSIQDVAAGGTRVSVWMPVELRY